MLKIKKIKCRNCNKLFKPEPRNAKRQRYCCKPECRKASKAASQRRWLQKPENRNYFRGPDNVKRVREWRKANPGYQRRQSAASQNALQDSLNAKPPENNRNITSSGETPSDALQDILAAQPFVLIGLLSNLTGLVLQDDIAMTMGRMQQLGIDIFNGSHNCKGDSHGSKISHLSRAHPKNPQTIQLGGSPSGP